MSSALGCQPAWLAWTEGAAGKLGWTEGAVCLRLPCITPCSAEREASASEAGGARLM